jgi:hypothetical protein
MTRIFGDRVNSPTIYTADIDLAASGTIVTGVAGQRIRVFAVKLAVTVELTCYFQDGIVGQIEGGILLSEKAGYIESVNPPAYLFSTSAGEDLILEMDKGNVTGRVSYWIE